MTNNKYIIKNLAPWMLDELIAFAEMARYDLILLRKQRDFYKYGLDQLKTKGINIYIKPYNNKMVFSKIKTILNFCISNFLKIRFNYNGVILLKSLVWFVRMDLSIFSKDSNIHAQFATQPAIISLLIKKHFYNLPSYSFTFHAYDIFFKNNWFEMLIKNCKYAISVSNYNIHYIEDNYSKGNHNKIILSRLGVFLPKKCDPNNKREFNKISVGLMSWFVEKKGILYLLESIKELVNNNFNVQLTLAGDGPLRDVILDYIASNKLNNHIIYIGKIHGEEKEKFFNDIDLFILPSIPTSKDMDGIPVVLMEAISYGIPIISTNVSGIPEICRHHINGLLVPPRDVIKLTEAILYFMEMSDKEYLKYSRNAIIISKEYNIIENSKNKIKILGFL